MKEKCRAEFDSSIDMSLERGSFIGFNKEIEEKMANHFEENYIKVTEDNFKTIKIRSMKDIKE